MNVKEIVQRANDGLLEVIPPVNPERMKECGIIWDDMRGVGK